MSAYISGSFSLMISMIIICGLLSEAVSTSTAEQKGRMIDDW
jgi:hypothetical protein